MQEILLDLIKNISEEDAVSFDVQRDTKFLGIFIGSGKDTKRIVFNFNHTKPSVNSLIVCKIILLDDSSYDISALLKVLKGAKLVNTYLKISVLLLSKNARANVLPALEITETDIKAGHGATVSMLSPEQMFYLASRGLSTSISKMILAEAFLNDTSKDFTTKSSQKYLAEKLSELKLQFME